MTTRIDQSAGKSSRASRGGMPSRPRRPPSTIRPPWANPCRPIPERRPRPVSSASSSIGGSGEPGELGQEPGDGQAELGARRRGRHAPAGRRSIREHAGGAGDARRRPGGRRPASATSSARLGQRARRPASRRRARPSSSSPGASIIRPTPPNCRGGLRPPAEEAEVEPARGPDAEARHGRGVSGSRPRRRATSSTWSLEQRERLALGGPPVFSTRTASFRNSARISSSGRNVDPGRQDRGLDHRVLGPVQAEEVAEAALGHGLGRDRRPLVAVVELDHAELVVAAGVDAGSGPGRRRPAGSRRRRHGRSPPGPAAGRRR